MQGEQGCTVVDGEDGDALRIGPRDDLVEHMTPIRRGGQDEVRTEGERCSERAAGPDPCALSSGEGHLIEHPLPVVRLRVERVRGPLEVLPRHVDEALAHATFDLGGEALLRLEVEVIDPRLLQSIQHRSDVLHVIGGLATVDEDPCWNPVHRTALSVGILNASVVTATFMNASLGLWA